MNDYMIRKIQFKMLDYRLQIAKDQLHGMKLSLIVINKDNLTDAEFKEFILEIEKELKEHYETKRVQMITKYHYLLKVALKVELPD